MIQYCHKRKYENGSGKVFQLGDKLYSEYGMLQISSKGGETVALEVIEPWFFDSLTVNDFFEKKVGFARCSDDDNYCKKTGREFSTSRMKSVRLVVKQILTNGEEKLLILMDANNNLYTLQKINGYKVRFIDWNKAG